ncbi:hypothetical protein Tco_1460922 [Tanacetum coccineum]
MSRLKTIQKGLSWITACLGVPSLGFAASSSFGLVTTQYLPSRPPTALRPNPVVHSVRRLRCVASLGHNASNRPLGSRFHRKRSPIFFFLCCYEYSCMILKPDSLFRNLGAVWFVVKNHNGYRIWYGVE